MAWTYTEGGTDNRDIVRLLIGDTDTNDQQLSDAEVNWITGQAANIYGMGALAAEILAAEYARKVDKKVGDLSLDDDQKQEHYKSLAGQLRMLARIIAVPLAGGHLITKKDDQVARTDRVPPRFARDQFIHPGSDENPADARTRPQGFGEN